MCPISLDVMADPVVAEDGITYDRAYIAAWVATHNTSPVTRAVIGNALIPNIAMRGIIAEYAVEAQSLAQVAVAPPQNNDQPKIDYGNDILEPLKQALCVKNKDIYYGSVVEQTLVGCAGIFTSQENAVFEESAKANGSFDLRFKLKFQSIEEHQRFSLFYRNNFKAAVVNNGLFNAELTEVLFNTEKFVESIIPLLGDFKKNHFSNLLADLKRLLNVDWNAVCEGDAVERRLTNKAGIFASQAAAYFRPNTDYSTVMHLNFLSSTQHQAFVSYYAENAPALIIKDYGFNKGDLSKFDLNPNALNRVAETMAEDFVNPAPCVLF